MNETLLAPFISRRKSIRSFSTAPLEQSVLDDIQSFIGTVTPLFPAIRTFLEVVGKTEVRGFALAAAPQYLVLYSERNPDADLNSGFILQQVDLYLSSRGLGSCWQGLSRPAGQEAEGLPYVIMLAFGTAAEPVHRSSAGEFHRKPLGEISSGCAISRYGEAVRLAPSAMNKQPWFFCGDGKCCRAFSVQGKGLISIGNGWRYIDLGIALCHLYLAATADGRKVSFRREDSIPDSSGNEYVLSCRID